MWLLPLLLQESCLLRDSDPEHGARRVIVAYHDSVQLDRLWQFPFATGESTCAGEVQSRMSLTQGAPLVTWLGCGCSQSATASTMSSHGTTSQLASKEAWSIRL